MEEKKEKEKNIKPMHANAPDTSGVTLLFKPCTHVASNLLAIDLQLYVQIVCDGLQLKFQHAEYFTLPIAIANSFHH